MFILNQTATYYNTARVDRFGKIAFSGAGIVLKARYDIKDGTYKDSRGQDIENLVNIHTEYNENIRVGGAFLLSNGLTYIVEVRTHTADRNGKFVKTWARVKEKSI